MDQELAIQTKKITRVINNWRTIKRSKRGWILYMANQKARAKKIITINVIFSPGCLDTGRCVFLPSIEKEVKLLSHQVTPHMSLN